jgi:hypothetical protein
VVFDFERSKSEVFENKELKEVFGPRRDESRGLK